MAIGDPPGSAWNPNIFDWRTDPTKEPALAQQEDLATWMPQFEENMLLTVQAVQRLHKAIQGRLP